MEIRRATIVALAGFGLTPGTIQKATLTALTGSGRTPGTIQKASISVIERFIVANDITALAIVEDARIVSVGSIQLSLIAGNMTDCDCLQASFVFSEEILRRRIQSRLINT